MASARRPQISRLTMLASVLLLALGLASPLYGVAPPLGLAVGAQAQGAPLACQAVGNNWTSCGNAFVSDDAYAYANATREPVQFARPNADVFAVNWTDSGGDTVQFDELDETSPDDDATYSQTGVNPDDGDDAEFNLTDIQDPQASDGHILRYRFRNAGPLGGNAQLDVRVELREGAILIASWDHADIRSTAYVSHSQTLSVAQADLIGNYSDLRVRLDVTFTPGSQSRQFRLTWIEFEAPGLLIPDTPSDTAWSRFGLGLAPSDTVRSVEVGVEWFRTSNAPILNITVSWNGGLAWAVNQTATNRSVDDDIVEWLNFTSAWAWDAATLNDTNLRLRLGTNSSGARLDHVTVRVNFLDVILDLDISASASSADPGDSLTLNATVRNLGSGPALNVLIEGTVDANATYISSTPLGTYDGVTRTVSWSIPSLPSGASSSVQWTVRINLGTPDQATVASSVRADGEDSDGGTVPPVEALATVVVQAPVFSPVFLLAPNQAERGDEIEAIVHHNNTGAGNARFAWLNWSLGGHFELVSLTPPSSVTNTSDGFNLLLADVTPGPHALTARLRVLRGLQDGLLMGLQVTWEATDGNGNALSDEQLVGTVRLLAPSVSLGLEGATQRLGAGSTFQVNVSIQNVGGGSGTGWLNLSLPSGFRYVADNGTFPVALMDGEVSWRLASVPAGEVLTLGIELQAGGGARAESLRFSMEYTDDEGTPPATAVSNALTVEVTGELVPAWLLWLAVALAAGSGPLVFLLIRRRDRVFSIEEVFVTDARGVLVAHLSRTLTPDKDRDVLAAMLKTVQDFVTDAFSSHDKSPMRRIEFGHHSILIERGLHHWVAAVFRGDDHTGLGTRLALVSEQIDLDYGEVLADWAGEMSRVQGIQDLLKHLWAEEGLSLGPIRGLLNRFREIWPFGNEPAEDPVVDRDEEDQDPTVAGLLRR
ncbi:MAG: DUF11 domain-containing protein [Thermoplasmata archaeon]